MATAHARVTTAGSVRTALFATDLDVEAVAGYGALLDPAEQAQAGRFRFARDRMRFIARRGQLRAELAGIVGDRPDRLRIAVDDHGKPFLRDYPDLHFNLSHSRDRALCAIGHGLPVGCDIEWRNPALACRDVAARLFAPDEYAALIALPDDQWVAGFFRCWTRKEAFVKALGLGLAYPLHAFSVSVAPDHHARLIEAPPGWTLSSFEPADGYQAALVTG